MDKKIRKAFMMQSLCILLVVLCISYVMEYTGKTASADNTNADNQISEQDKPLVEASANGNTFSEDMLGDTYIQIPKTSEAMLQPVVEDRYMEQSILLSISGIPDKYFSENSIERVCQNKYYFGKVDKNNTNDPVSSVSIKYTYNQNNFSYTADITIGTKSLYAPALYETEAYIYIALQNPRDIYDKIVVIDPGHGGNDTGTYSTDLKYVEATYTLDIALLLKDYLDNSEIKAYYTRLEDEDISLKKRTKLANALQADFLISIHCNGAETIDLSGVGMEALYRSEKTKTNEKLAKICLGEMTNATKRYNRGALVRKDLYLLNHAEMPVTILEVGFMSNNKDMSYLKKEKNCKKIASGIFNGIQKAYQEIDLSSKQ